MTTMHLALPSWPLLAACRDMDTSLFFPEDHEYAKMKAAKAVCAVCPVRQHCFDHAVENAEMYGIWGGTSQRARVRERRRRGLMQRPSEVAS